MGLLIGMVGNYPGVGKDTSARILQEQHGFVAHSFANKLYEEVAKAYAIPVEEWQRRDLKETPQERFALRHCRNEEFQAMGMAILLREFGQLTASEALRVLLSPRMVLRWWGTEFRRNHYGPDYFTAPVFARVRANPEQDHCILDSRLGNELIGIVRSGGYIGRILRPAAAPAVLSDHPSEILARIWPEDFVIDNSGSLDRLQAQWAKQLPRLRELQAA